MFYVSIIFLQAAYLVKKNNFTAALEFINKVSSNTQAKLYDSIGNGQCGHSKKFCVSAHVALRHYHYPASQLYFLANKNATGLTRQSTE